LPFLCNPGHPKLRITPILWVFENEGWIEPIKIRLRATKCSQSCRQLQSVQDEEVERLMLENGSVCVKVKKVPQQAFSVS
jgi:hypothetical protein